MFCRGCRYPISQIEARHCPECGRAFDPHDPKTYFDTEHSGFARHSLKLIEVIAACVVIGVFATFGFIVVGCEYWMPLSVHLWYVPCVLVGCAFGASFAYVASRSRLFVIPFVLMALVLCSLTFITLSPIKPYLKALHDIQPGLRPAQVQAIIDAHFPRGGRFRQPVGWSDANNMYYSLDPTDGRYNAAILRVELVNGRVVRAVYDPD